MMLLLNVLPLWIFTAVATGLIIVGLFIHFIGIPGLVVPRWVTNFIGILFFCAGVFIHGGLWTQREYLIQLEEAKQQIAKIESQSKQITEKVVVQYRDKIVTIREQGETIVKEIPKYITVESDAKCDVPNGFVVLHDATAQTKVPPAPSSTDGDASGVKISEVGRTVSQNYTTCNQVREQLKSLQEWVRLQEKNYNETK